MRAESHEWTTSWARTRALRRVSAGSAAERAEGAGQRIASAAIPASGGIGCPQLLQIADRTDLEIRALLRVAPPLQMEARGAELAAQGRTGTRYCSACTSATWAASART
jgi:hypothetical protein